MFVAIICGHVLRTTRNPPGFPQSGGGIGLGICCGPLIFPALRWWGIFSKTRKQHRCRCGMLAGVDLNLGYIFLFLGWFFCPRNQHLLPNTRNWIVRYITIAFRCYWCRDQLCSVAFTVSQWQAPPPKRNPRLVGKRSLPPGCGFGAWSLKRLTNTYLPLKSQSHYFVRTRFPL